MTDLGTDSGKLSLINTCDHLLRKVATAFVAFTLLAGFLYWTLAASAMDKIAEFSMGNAADLESSSLPSTALLPLQTSWEQGVLGGRGEGLSCSLPDFVKPIFAGGPPNSSLSKAAVADVNVQFRQACVRHDYCYRHGAATYGYSQSDCDTFLAEDAVRICAFIFPPSSDLLRDEAERIRVHEAKIAWCKTRARKVLGGVVLGAAAAFRSVVPRQQFQVRNDALRDLQMESSTRLEYDAYPSGDAEYFALRLLKDGCGAGAPMLATYQRNKGGSAMPYRCLSREAKSHVWTLGPRKLGHQHASEFDRLTGAPWIARLASKPGTAAQKEGLNYWCRDYIGRELITGGFLSFSLPEPAPSSEEGSEPSRWFTQCAVNDILLLAEQRAEGVSSADSASTNQAIGNADVPPLPVETEGVPSNAPISAKTNISGEADDFPRIRPKIDFDTPSVFPLPPVDGLGISTLFLRVAREADGAIVCEAWAPPDHLIKTLYMNAVRLSDSQPVDMTTKAEVLAKQGFLRARPGRKVNGSLPEKLDPRERASARFRIALPKPPGTVQQNCYRWFATPPQFVSVPASGGLPAKLHILFFRRGLDDGGHYADRLDVFRATLGLEDHTLQDTEQENRGGKSSGFVDSGFSQQVKLSELEEPFVALPYAGDGVALLALFRDDESRTGLLKIWFFGWTLAIVALAFLAWQLARFGFGWVSRAGIEAAPRSFWQGTGFGAAVLIGGSGLLVVALLERDDVARVTRLGTTVTIGLWPISEGAKPMQYRWEATQGDHITPSAYLQNRMSIVADRRDGSTYLIAPHFKHAADEASGSCALDAEIALLRFPASKTRAPAVEIRHANVRVPITSPATTPCEQRLKIAIGRMALLPFERPGDILGKEVPEALLVHSTVQNNYVFLGDLRDQGRLKKTLLPTSQRF